MPGRGRRAGGRERRRLHPPGQGRETNPSPQVVDALGRALRLGADARTHLFRLAGINPRTKADSFRDQVHPALLRLLDAFPTAAACVMGPAFGILATNTNTNTNTNTIADALLPPPRGRPACRGSCSLTRGPARSSPTGS
ncbi:hypothetical protein ABZ656_28340 [Streptomyces sp. NPDC007095]|uniref:hypothetical protein n=1 Tax=Streptomyces sp. NPDC007095 TaxID=3154482 RepID=UPI0033EC1F47